jgi:two-component system KDP operon response regulator KdpE
MQVLLASIYPEETPILTVILQQAGFLVRPLHGLAHLQEAWLEHPSDLILITTSGRDTGLAELLRQLRGISVAVLVILSEPVSENQQIEWLEAGADLVMPRPYSPRLLLAQLRTLARRGVGMPYSGLPAMTQAGLSLDPSSRTVTIGSGEPIHLTQLEFRLLFTLMTHAGRTVPSENLVETIWGYPGEGNRELVRGLVQRLRAKLEDDPHNPNTILTEAGVGYRFEIEAR